MRIACLYLPSFALQAHVRQAPHLVGAPVVVADSGLQGSTVMTCSRAAWEEGVRPGMPTATARVIVPGVCVQSADPELYERALAAVIDCVSGLSDAVDLGSQAERTGPNRVLYLRVPPRMRGDSFGQRLLGQLARQGFRGRVGVADDRFTAHVAAVTVSRPGGPSRLDDDARSPLFQQSCTSVPRGGSAAFLAPLPLSYLPIDPEVQRMLQTCGVKTMGDFAALPPPSVSRGWIDVDFRALARGEGPAVVRGLARSAVLERPVVEHLSLPAAPAAGPENQNEPVEIRARVAIDFAPVTGVAGELPVDGEVTRSDEVARAVAWQGALRTLCDRIAHRLDGRERVATRLLAKLRREGGEVAMFDVLPGRATASGRELLEALLAQSRELQDTAWTSIEIAVTQEAERTAGEMALFAGADAVDAPAVDVTVGARPGLEVLAARAEREAPEPALTPERHHGARLAATTPRLAHRSPSPSRGRTRRRMPLQQQLF
jgi:hypothetical protein